LGPIGAAPEPVDNSASVANLRLVPQTRWARMLAGSAGAALSAVVFYLLRAGVHWSFGGFLIALAIFFVPTFLVFLIVDGGGQLLDDEHRRNDASGTAPSPVDSWFAWRSWRARQNDR
jgi:hypothetical protein